MCSTVVTANKAYPVHNCGLGIIIIATGVYMLVQISGKQNNVSQQQNFDAYTTNTPATTAATAAVATSPTITVNVSSTSTTAITITTTTYTFATIAAAVTSLVKSSCFYIVYSYLTYIYDV